MNAATAATASHNEALARVREPVPSKRQPKAVKAMEEQGGAAVPTMKKRSREATEADTGSECIPSLTAVF